MLVTDRFVYIHQPKTGGTFVTSALLKVHEADWNYRHFLRFMLTGRVRLRGRRGDIIFTAGKHAQCRHIPPDFQDRPILSTMRNPFDYYVSQYEFGWWKRRQYWKDYRRIDHFSQLFPTFPELSFPDFVRLMTLAYNPAQQQDFDNPTQVGYFTTSFLQYFFRRPDELLPRVNDVFFTSGAWREAMYPVHFLHTDQLNAGLHGYLADAGYPAESIDFIRSKERELPGGRGRTTEQKWQRYYTPELLQLMRQKDRFLFELFPRYDHLTRQAAG